MMTGSSGTGRYIGVQDCPVCKERTTHYASSICKTYMRVFCDICNVERYYAKTTEFYKNVIDRIHKGVI
jgi:hypothetical protein